MNKLLLALQNLSNVLNNGKGRTVKAKKNIVGSIFIKGTSIAISLIMVPLTIEYVNPSRYGIWLTLSSIVAWFSFFNIGLTHGLRNKFAEAKAKGDDATAQVYVSTTYGILTLIFCFVWIIFLFVNPFLDWTKILNVPSEMRSEVSMLAVIVFTYFCLQFILKIVNTLIIADQQPAKASLLDLLGQVVSVIFIGFLVKTTEGSLVNLGWALCLSPILVLIGSNLFFFKGKYYKYRPRISKINFNESKGLFNLGLTFFVIQIAGLVQYQTANVIISQNFGALEVTSYNIVYKYFNILGMAISIFLSPLWSASTDAYYKKDIDWIKKALQKYLQLFIFLMLIGLVMLFMSEKVYDLWLKGKVDIDFNLSLWGYIFVGSFMFGNIFVNFLNGISALRIQFWTSMISPILYICIALVLIKYFGVGPHALFIASLVANINGIIIAPIQYYLIIYKNKKGIWLK
jgi:O-antigen/teichoic acid export membrane protein